MSVYKFKAKNSIFDFEYGKTNKKGVNIIYFIDLEFT